MPISKRKILKNMREGFARPEGEPSAGCSVAQRNPQKPDPKGRPQIKNQSNINDIFLNKFQHKIYAIGIRRAWFIAKQKPNVMSPE